MRRVTYSLPLRSHLPAFLRFLPPVLQLFNVLNPGRRRQMLTPPPRNKGVFEPIFSEAVKQVKVTRTARTGASLFAAVNMKG